jgi:hypothetical protein
MSLKVGWLPIQQPTTTNTMISDNDFLEIINQSCIAFRQAAQDKMATIVAEINKAHAAGEDAFKMTHSIKLNLNKMKQEDELKFSPAPISTKVESPIDLEDDDQPILPGIRDSVNAAGTGDSGAPIDDVDEDRITVQDPNEGDDDEADLDQERGDQATDDELESEGGDSE